MTAASGFDRTRDPTGGPHDGGPILAAGPPPAEAPAAVILLHGRGAGAADILGLAGELERPDVAFLAPEAARWTWYPNRFMAPRAANEPFLSSALAVIQELVERLGGAGVPPERVVLAGFSQGACLAAESAMRSPRRWGGVVALTGGLIGPPDGLVGYPDGTLAGTRALLGAGDTDPHVPWARVEETAGILASRGADVDLRRYPGLPHTIHPDSLVAFRALLDALASPA